MKKNATKLLVFMGIFIPLCFVILTNTIFKGAHTNTVSSSTVFEENTQQTQPSNELYTLKRMVITDFFKQQTHTLNLSNHLKNRIHAGEFNSVWDQEFEVYDVQVFSQKDFGEIQVAYIDVILERNQMFQWLQLKSTWKKEQLIDLVYQDLNYSERINELSGYTEAVTFAKNLLESINQSDQSSFGWRLQDTHPMTDHLVNLNIKSVHSLGIYSPQTKPEDIEVLLTANYDVYSEELDHHKTITALLYVKRYDGKWQLENIQVLDIEEIQ